MHRWSYHTLNCKKIIRRNSKESLEYFFRFFFLKNVLVWTETKKTTDLTKNIFVPTVHKSASSLGALPSTVTRDSLQLHRIAWQSFMFLMFKCTHKSENDLYFVYFVFWFHRVVGICLHLPFFCLFLLPPFFYFYYFSFLTLQCQMGYNPMWMKCKINKSKPPINTSRHRVRLITIWISNTQLAIFRNSL